MLASYLVHTGLTQQFEDKSNDNNLLIWHLSMNLFHRKVLAPTLEESDRHASEKKFVFFYSIL
jgi:hypothetical protein